MMEEIKTYKLIVWWKKINEIYTLRMENHILFYLFTFFFAQKSNSKHTHSRSYKKIKQKQTNQRIISQSFREEWKIEQKLRIR